MEIKIDEALRRKQMDETFPTFIESFYIFYAGGYALRDHDATAAKLEEKTGTQYLTCVAC